MITFDEIIEASQSGPMPLEWEPGGCLKMVNHFHPFSIKPIEFRTIAEYIIHHGLQRGFEIGTGVGISALAAAIGMQATGGHMVTLDSYIEEHHNHYLAYTHLSEVYDQTADAYRGLRHLRKAFRLENVLSLEIGRSPECVQSLVKAHYGSDKLDYVMIDAEHTNEGLLRDLEAVRPHLAEKHAIFLHDTHCFDASLVADAFWFPHCKIPDGWNLAVIENFRSGSSSYEERVPLLASAAL
jgi:hypothetical protein